MPRARTGAAHCLRAVAAGTAFALRDSGMTGLAYKAVCYKCSYVGLGADADRCPVCEFPFILEAGPSPEVAPDIAVIFDRASVRIGAPPLPGVDAGPRKAQLLMESRKRRLEQKRRTTSQPAVAPPGRGRLAVAFACASAVVAGVVAAVLFSGAA